MKYLAKFIFLIQRICNRIYMNIIKHLFKKCGKGVILAGRSSFSFHNIELGDDVYIGEQAVFMAGEAPIIIGNKVMFAPRVTIITGDHRMDVVGKYIKDVTEKRKGIDDLPVIIEEDVWVGAGVIILKGVTIGRGSVIAAGSIVTKSIPEYTVYIGSNRILSRPRWTEEEIEMHKKLLYKQ